MIAPIYPLHIVRVSAGIRHRTEHIVYSTADLVALAAESYCSDDRYSAFLDEHERIDSEDDQVAHALDQIGADAFSVRIEVRGCVISQCMECGGLLECQHHVERATVQGGAK